MTNPAAGNRPSVARTSDVIASTRPGEASPMSLDRAWEYVAWSDGVYAVIEQHLGQEVLSPEDLAGAALRFARARRVELLALNAIELTYQGGVE